MDIRNLKQFVALSDSLHFGRASEVSHVSSSALSRSIRQLEDEVGATLFERNNRSVSLTHAGGLFLVYARDALTQWDSVLNTLMEESGELYGEVSMYCSVTASYSFLFDLLSRFRMDHPRIEIKLHTGDPEHAITRVLAGNEDISIGARPSQLPNSLAFKPIAVSPLVFIAARKKVGMNKVVAGLVRGKQEGTFWAATPMILSESGIARRRVDHWFSELGIKPDIYAQVAGNEAIVSMVSLGFGVGVVPRIVLDNSPLAKKVVVLDVQPELEAYDVGLFTQKKKLGSPLINAFWSQLK
ncbi:MAG: HTH-type transcriptional activator IlvY [Gammaproteobacteria bacterium]|nr:HTH-type transcriptional activator IlvY [Gammaproteobacteria bacterium]MCP4088309.1 HTH-type transcriptional activator IlvY [Gammaproteobacteria bacterium]MCP4276380.1 HTH-type transcriptional activator IlvY [Gammaproteobacteria bacterium]MCP4831027.1 HTH-type transcriptional activator IlvY [Gammaproteobacteria bacterium]MCP4927452.1 HTH-type transcriptional activator IlvY [Gammaproteobacteria bacterium]